MLSPDGLGIIEDTLGCDVHNEDPFCGLSMIALLAFERIKLDSTYPKGAFLFMEGQAPRGVFVLCKGQIKLSLCAGDGKTYIYKVAKPGELLGLSATISGKPYGLSAQTLEPCQVNFVRREDFLCFLKNNSDACVKVAEQLGVKYSTACRELRSLGLAASAGEKLARLLLECCCRDGESSNAELRVRLPITQDEIARMIGCCRETVTWLFTDLRRRRIAERKRSTLLIHDKVALEALAENRLGLLRRNRGQRPVI